MHRCTLGLRQNRLGAVITPQSHIPSPAHVAHTWDTLGRLPGSKQTLLPLFLPASLFNFSIFPPCHHCPLSLGVSLTKYQVMLEGFFYLFGWFLVYRN